MDISKMEKKGMGISQIVVTKLCVGIKNKCFHIFHCAEFINTMYYPKAKIEDLE